MQANGSETQGFKHRRKLSRHTQWQTHNRSFCPDPSRRNDWGFVQIHFAQVSWTVPKWFSCDTMSSSRTAVFVTTVDLHALIWSLHYLGHPAWTQSHPLCLSIGVFIRPSLSLDELTWVKQRKFHWLLSSELLTKRVFSPLIIHHLSVINCITIGNFLHILVPKCINIALKPS